MKDELKDQTLYRWMKSKVSNQLGKIHLCQSSAIFNTQSADPDHWFEVAQRGQAV